MTLLPILIVYGGWCVRPRAKRVGLNVCIGPDWVGARRSDEHGMALEPKGNMFDRTASCLLRAWSIRQHYFCLDCVPG
jgi:hypothetical protein